MSKAEKERRERLLEDDWPMQNYPPGGEKRLSQAIKEASKLGLHDPEEDKIKCICK